MKIVYVYPHFRDFGGTERVLIDKMNYFASQEGYEVFSVTHKVKFLFSVIICSFKFLISMLYF
jgi:hypothetical protein